MAVAAITYNIPATRVRDFAFQQTVVRVRDVAQLAGLPPDSASFKPLWVQLPVTAVEPGLLDRPPAAFPLDLVLERPGADFPVLYEVVSTAAQVPVRITIPVLPGFGKALRLAASLDFPIKLDLGQPPPALIQDLLDGVSFYLHHPGVSQPIEPFQSLLRAFFRNNPASLWLILEQDPARYRYVTEDGRELSPGTATGDPLPPTAEPDKAGMGRNAGVRPERAANGAESGEPENFVTDWLAELCRNNAECGHCEFVEICLGYHKWPDPSYACAGIKKVFRKLEDAAAELNRDVAALAGEQTMETPP